MNVNKTRRIWPKALKKPSAGAVDHRRTAHWRSGASGQPSTRETESCATAEDKNDRALGSPSAGEQLMSPTIQHTSAKVAERWRVPSARVAEGQNVQALCC